MARVIKINFEGKSQDVELPSPLTIVGLQAASASTFDLKGESKPDSLQFTWLDIDCEEIPIKLDSELVLAVRLREEPLVLYASLPGNEQQDRQLEEGGKDGEVADLYEVAAEKLRTSHSVPSMTATKLRKTIELLQLPPGRLVGQGLAPRRLLRQHKAAESKSAPPAANDADEHDGHGNDDHSAPEKSGLDQTATEAVPEKDPVHKAFVAGGVTLEPEETGPLLHALGVGPGRLVKIGLVEQGKLRAPRSRPHGSARGGVDTAGSPEDDRDIYEVAAEALRSSHGVASITRDGVRSAIAVLQLHPRRLVAQGLAPRRLLRGEDAPTVDAPDEDAKELQEEKEEKKGSDDTAVAAPSAPKNPIHGALVAGGVQPLAPDEAHPLLHALGIGPQRLVKLGLVERKALDGLQLRSRAPPQSSPSDADGSGDIYEVAAGALRASHGVPSITAENLKKTIVVLRLQPRRLVARGLAPRHLLKGDAAEVSATADGKDDNEDAGEEEEQDVEHAEGEEEHGGGDKEEAKRDEEPPVKKTNPVHAALAANGISVNPPEARPLLDALGVKPHLLVKLGLMKRGEGHHGAVGGRGRGAGRGEGRGHGRGRGRGHGRGTGRGGHHGDVAPGAPGTEADVDKAD